MDLTEQNKADTFVPVSSLGPALDAESNSGSRSGLISTDPSLTGVPRGRLDALVRRFSEEPRIAPRSTHFLASSAVVTGPNSLDSSLEAPAPPPSNTGHAMDVSSPNTEDAKKAKKPKRKFTKEEDDVILDAVRTCGEDWQKISELLINRAPAQIRGRYRRLVPKQGNANGEEPAAVDGANEAIQQQPAQPTDHVVISSGLPPMPFIATSPAKIALQPASNRQKRPANGDADGPQAKKPKGRTSQEDGANANVATLPGKFGWKVISPSGADQPSSPASPMLPSRSNSPTHHTYHDIISLTASSSGASNTPSKPASTVEIDRHMDIAVPPVRIERDVLAAKREEELMAQIATLTSEKDKLARELTSKEQTWGKKEHEYVNCLKRASDEIMVALIESERRMRSTVREKLAQESARLGQPVYGRIGQEFRDGVAFKVWREKEARLEERRAALETTKKALSKTKLQNPERDLEDIVMQEHLIKVKQGALKAEEQELQRERDALGVQTHLHVKELRRFQEEEASRFNTFPILNNQYLMLHLLGKGGFSEVYLAYDLKKFRNVACKIHQFSRDWPADKKMSYMRRAMRECDIHRALVHPRIVAMHDSFEVDDSTICTVMEYCPGGDLDSYLKQNKTLSEIEARVLIAQLFDGLRYLMTRENDKQKIIHYDLKPGNLLFDDYGSLKIADFGLSKIMENDTESMDLTSQGAGTYWYLPPECFDPDKPKISGKVDVWSAGVILYQMLFGCKPFGHNAAQHSIIEQNMIHSNIKVEFPPANRTKVSEEAKQFLSRCLTANVAERPNALELINDPFLTFVQSKRAGTSLTPQHMGPPAPLNLSAMPNTITSIGGGTITVISKK